MTYYSIWPFFIIMAFILSILSLPYFSKIKANASPVNRVQTIDGLRGFLAYGVVFSHGQNFHTLLETGQWAGSPNPFYNLFGTIAVRMFFMITAYLFWSKLLVSYGQVKWPSFYIKRVFRIGPVYWCACFCVFFIVMIETHWTMQVSWVAFCKQIGAWLALGILPLPDINNHVMTFMILLGVVWTLQYEWLFYALLPLISWFAKSRAIALFFIISALIITFIISFFVHYYPIFSQVLSVLFMFLIGMLCATLQQYSLKVPLPPITQSFLASVLMILIFLYVPDGVYFSSIIFGMIFFLIISDCSIFGLLTLPASQRLGEISYGIYLLQGIVFYWVYSAQSIRYYVLQNSLQFWGIMTLICCLILYFSIFVHIIFERTGIRLAYKLSGLLNIKNL